MTSTSCDVSRATTSARPHVPLSSLTSEARSSSRHLLPRCGRARCRRLRFRQDLFDLAHFVPWIGTELRHPILYIAERIDVGGTETRQFLPGKRRRHARRCARPRRIWRDGGGAAAVTQIVDVDFALALPLCYRRRVASR